MCDQALSKEGSHHLPTAEMHKHQEGRSELLMLGWTC